VRTDTLERMAAEGEISLEEFRVLNPQPRDQVPFLRSTPLYPEWPMARLRHAPAILAERVAMALLAMTTGSQAARAASYAGWTIAEDYQPVHECLRSLQMGPYQSLGAFSLADVASKYWHLLVLTLLLFLTMAGFSAWVWRLNRRLKNNHQKLAR
jgi:two-component system sensor histidine kinase TtrS